MSPTQLSAELRRIASAIDASKNPSRALVAQDIRRLLAVMADDPQFVAMKELVRQLGEAMEGKSEGDMEDLLSEKKILEKLIPFLRRRESDALRSKAG